MTLAINPVVKSLEVAITLDEFKNYLTQVKLDTVVTWLDKVEATVDLAPDHLSRVDHLMKLIKFIISVHPHLPKNQRIHYFLNINCEIDLDDITFDSSIDMLYLDFCETSSVIYLKDLSLKEVMK